MKSFLIPGVLLIGAFFLAGCASDTGVVAHRDSFRLLPESVPELTLRIERGDSRDAVLSQLGRPSFAIGQDLWFFRGIYGLSSGNDPSLDTLAVEFSRDRVMGLRVVNGEAVRNYLRSLPRVGEGR